MVEEEIDEEVEEETRTGGLKGDRCLLHTAPGGGVLIRRRRRSSGR